jgi:hypothetical protein
MPSMTVVVFILLVFPQFLGPDVHWTLAQSTVTYQASHPLQDIEGVSHSARGNGVCHAGTCSFRIAVALKTFESGSRSRDLEMLKAVRGAQFPSILVRFHFVESALASATIRADLNIQFAGGTVGHKEVLFHRETEGKNTEITGTIPIRLSDFHIKPPEFLAIRIKNEVLVRVKTTWLRL